MDNDGMKRYPMSEGLKELMDKCRGGFRHGEMIMFSSPHSSADERGQRWHDYISKLPADGAVTVHKSQGGTWDDLIRMTRNAKIAPLIIDSCPDDLGFVFHRDEMAGMGVRVLKQREVGKSTGLTIDIESMFGFKNPWITEMAQKPVREFIQELFPQKGRRHLMPTYEDLWLSKVGAYSNTQRVRMIPNDEKQPLKYELDISMRRQQMEYYIDALFPHYEGEFDSIVFMPAHQRFTKIYDRLVKDRRMHKDYLTKLSSYERNVTMGAHGDIVYDLDEDGNKILRKLSISEKYGVFGRPSGDYDGNSTVLKSKKSRHPRGNTPYIEYYDDCAFVKPEEPKVAKRPVGILASLLNRIDK